MRSNGRNVPILNTFQIKSIPQHFPKPPFLNKYNKLNAKLSLKLYRFEKCSLFVLKISAYYKT